MQYSWDQGVSAMTVLYLEVKTQAGKQQTLTIKGVVCGLETVQATSAASSALSLKATITAAGGYGYYLEPSFSGFFEVVNGAAAAEFAQCTV